MPDHFNIIPNSWLFQNDQRIRWGWGGEMGRIRRIALSFEGRRFIIVWFKGPTSHHSWHFFVDIHCNDIPKPPLNLSDIFFLKYSPLDLNDITKKTLEISDFINRAYAYYSWLVVYKWGAWFSLWDRWRRLILSKWVFEMKPGISTSSAEICKKRFNCFFFKFFSNCF